jgi:hypothetical protein
MQLLALCVGALAAGSVQGFAAVDDSNDLKILHWVHVPKAGGTAITALLKKVVCQINPSIRKTNPCCRKQLCLHSNACHAAVGGCPLVTAIGRHLTNMGVATSIPCCSSDLAMGITASFVYFALPTADILLKDEYARASLPIWPLVDRVAFLLSTGIRTAAYLPTLQKCVCVPIFNVLLCCLQAFHERRFISKSRIRNTMRS